MKRFGLLIAGASLWLFLAASSVLADGGVHVTALNSGTSSLTADSCAGCHRAHTAKAEYLLAAASEQALCLSCHNGTGATTDVLNGIQYAPQTDGTADTGVVLGALRDGGFQNARIDSSNAVRTSYIRGFENGPVNTEYALSTRPKVGVKASGSPVTSAHMDLTGVSTPNGIADMKTVWGKGDLNSGAGMTNVSLSCVDCHNPHGNGNYRILRPVPGTETDPLGEPEPMRIKATYANFGTIVTESQHGLVVGDQVKFAGTAVTGSGLSTTTTYYVVTVTNGFTFKVSTTFGGTATTLTSATYTTLAEANVLRPQVVVSDSPVGTPVNNVYPTKNYTVLQVKGVQGTDSTFLLYAADVLAAKAGNGIAQDQASKAVTVVGIGSPVAYWFQTSGASGLAVGDLVTMAGTFDGFTPGSTAWTVSAIGSSGSVYDRFQLATVTLTGTTATSATVVRKGIPGTYTAQGGDYFRRTVPWSPKIENSSCSYTFYDPISANNAANSAYCATMNDAPNGRPGTISAPSSGTGPASLYGQIAFVDQISPWCSQCHTRYYQNTNENLGNEEPVSAITDRPIGRASTSALYPSVYATTQAQYGNPGYGDRVIFSGFTGANAVLNGFQISAVSGGDTFTTTSAPTFAANRIVYMGTGITGLTAGEYTVLSVSGSTFKLTGVTGLTAQTFSSNYPTVNATYYVVGTAGSGTSANFSISATMAGTAIALTADTSGSGLTPAYSGTIGTFTKTYQSSNSGWGYPREDSIFKYQHSTASNRACTVCHVAHGSNALMTGAYTQDVAYPDGTVPTVTSSRLLKVDNRGTCQLCHDPTGTVAADTTVGYLAYALIP